MIAGWMNGKWGLTGILPESAEAATSNACHQAWKYLRAWRQAMDLDAGGEVLDAVVARKVRRRDNQRCWR
jgi:hypothetical protein